MRNPENTPGELLAMGARVGVETDDGLALYFGPATGERL